MRQGRTPTTSRQREERRDGRRIAQLFRQHRGLLDVRCCNLDEILAEDEIEIVASEFDHPGYAACLVRTEGLCGIMLPNGQSGGRRRFSIAHELGHFHIPSHGDVNGYCRASDMFARENSAALREWEANDFASELLMPFRFFAADADAREISIGSAIELAGPVFYDVSIMAAALRIVQTTRHAAALVASTNGRVSWLAKSDSFKWWLPEPAQRLHHDTMAAAAFRRVEVSERPLPVPLDAWFERSRPASGELLESTYRIDSQEQIVSLLWHIDGDDDPEED